MGIKEGTVLSWVKKSPFVQSDNGLEPLRAQARRVGPSPVREENARDRRRNPPSQDDFVRWKVSMQSLITQAYHLGTISDGQRRAMYMRLSKAGYRTREPATLDPPVEKPSLMSRLAQRHLDELGYSRAELREFISIGETDFRKYCLANDILESLGINEILNSRRCHEFLDGGNNDAGGYNALCATGLRNM